MSLSDSEWSRVAVYGSDRSSKSWVSWVPGRCPESRLTAKGRTQVVHHVKVEHRTSLIDFIWFYFIFTTIYCIYISFKSIVKPAEFKLGIILLNFWIFYNTREKTLTEINSDRSTKLQSLVLIQLPSGFG